MKIKFIKASNWLLSLAIGVVGFSGCRNSGNENVDEYGTPSADYIISGKVTDSNDKPIQGIEVSATQFKLKSEDGHPVYPILKDTTDREGNYKIEDLRAFPNGYQYYVDFNDIDAEVNGFFKEKADSVKTGSLVGGYGGWYEGKAEMTLNAKLKEVEAEE